MIINTNCKREEGYTQLRWWSKWDLVGPLPKCVFLNFLFLIIFWSNYGSWESINTKKNREIFSANQLNRILFGSKSIRKKVNTIIFGFILKYSENISLWENISYILYIYMPAYRISVSGIIWYDIIGFLHRYHITFQLSVPASKMTFVLEHNWNSVWF